MGETNVPSFQNMNTFAGESNIKEADMHYATSAEIFRNAKKLRNKLTYAEKMLWSRLSKNQLGVKFRRQHPIGDYIADYYCNSLKLIIEVDGEYHETNEQVEIDRARDETLSHFGIKTLRIKNDEVINDIESIIESIKLILKQRKFPL